MMNKILSLPMLLMLVLNTSCNKYKIEGTTSDSGLDGKTLYIKYMASDKNWHAIDSCEVIHGEFSMNGNADSIVMGALFMENAAIMPLVVESGNIKIEINDRNTKVKGTALNDRLYDFLDKQKKIEAKLNELYHKENQMILNGENPDMARDMVNREGQELNDEMSKLVIDFITNNFENPLGVGVFMMAVSNMTYPIETPEITQIMDKAPESFKNNFIVKDFMTAARENTRRMQYGGGR